MFDIKAAKSVMRLVLQFPPVVIGWNRLEGRPRTAEFERALAAEVRDALWFLTRQWQFGEFKGEDAGSPVEVRTSVRVDPLQHFAAARDAAVAYDARIPLETCVEGETVPFDLKLHSHVTRTFWRLIGAVLNQAAVRALYVSAYPLTLGAVAGDMEDDDARRAWKVAQSRVLNGAALLEDSRGGAHDARVDGFAALSSGDRAALKQAGRDLVSWFDQQFAQPGATIDAWRPRFLEYQFAVATDTADRGQTVLTADQYRHGHLDWYAFDIDGTAGAQLTRADGSVAISSAGGGKPLSFIPTPVSFAGMPSHRYWEMETREIEFADVDAHTTDIAKLLLTEFVLVHGNDWCVIPYELAIGTLTEVVGMIVSDDFGEQSLLLPAGRGFEDRWQRWAMFTMTRSSVDGGADARFLLAAAAAKTLEAPPLEKVHFIRDEMANMAWGVERVVLSGLGEGVSGYAVAARAVGQTPVPPPLQPTTAPVRYVLGTDVPYNWIPFIPVHLPNSVRSVELRRARMPTVAGATSRAPRTRILGAEAKYYVNEEEIPRSGKLVTRAYQRTRWLGGTAATWVGRRVTTGRGEGSSGLAFDQVVPVEPQE
jgi:hypothetical protein